MSRGIGRLQREILETLDDARQQETAADAWPPRGVGYAPATIRYWVEGEPRSGALPDGVYDLTATLHLMAERHGQRRRSYTRAGPTVDGTFAVSFARAARGLVERGLLVPASLTAGDVCPCCGRGGWRSRPDRLRFVRRPDPTTADAEVDDETAAD